MMELNAGALHDCTLLSILFEWQEQAVTLKYEGYSMAGSLRADGVTDLHVPCVKDWGSSVFINMTAGPKMLNDGLCKLDIEMQSGDVITIVARSFKLS